MTFIYQKRGMISMGNTAKCRLCESVMYAKEQDVTTCKCGEVTLDGVNKKIICLKSIHNYLEIDDVGNEIVDVKPLDIESPKPNRDELINMLDEMIKNIENLPSHAMQGPINHYDFASALLLLSSILRAS